MAARGDLRHHTAVGTVLVELREDEVCADLAARGHHRGGGLVAGGLDPQDHEFGRKCQRVGRSCHGAGPYALSSEEHTSELQSLMRISYAVFWLKKKHKTA